MASFFADENFPLPVVVALRARGHDVLTLQEAGRGGRAFRDPDVLSEATAASRCVLTLDRADFIRLHRSRPEHAGIVVCTFDPDFVGQALRIDTAVREVGTLDGRLLRVNRPA